MTNYALLSIPAYTFLSLAPHAYAFSLAAKGAPLNNANPHGSGYVKAIEKGLGPKGFQQYERAESAHRNTIENAPLFIGTVLATILAEKTSGQDLGSTSFAATFFGLRILYTLLYINTESEAWAKLRSFTFLGTVGLAAWQIWKSAVALG